MFCPLKSMTDLAELWVARTMDIRTSKTCSGGGLICVTASLVCTHWDPQHLSFHSVFPASATENLQDTLPIPPLGQAHPCPRIAYSNGSVFSVEFQFRMEFYQLISMAHLSSAGCWKAAGDHAGVRTLSCGEGCFCPCGTEQGNFTYRSQGSSCCSLWPRSPV